MQEILGQLMGMLKSGGTLAFTFEDHNYDPVKDPRYDLTIADQEVSWGPNLRHRLLRLKRDYPEIEVEQSFLRARIVANADIFFDETLALLEEEPLAGRMLCLSRWDQAADGTFRHFVWPDSQDAWIFENADPSNRGEFLPWETRVRQSSGL